MQRAARRYRKVSVQVWNDRKFRSLSDDGKFLWLCCLTHPQLTSVGLLPVSIAGLASMVRWDHARVARSLDELETNQMVVFDHDEHCLFMPNWFTHNRPENPNVIKGWRNALELVPECRVRDQALAAAHACVQQTGNQRFIDAFGDLFGESSRRRPIDKFDPTDPVFVAVASIWYQNNVIKRMRNEVLQYCQDFRELCRDLSDDAIPAEIQRRMQLYCQRWPDAACTAKALIRHWGDLDGQVATETRPRNGDDYEC